MLAFLDNGFFIFLVIAILSAVSDWISKRRAAAKEEEEDSLPIPSDGRTSSPPPLTPGSKKQKVPRLFEHLERELKRLAEDSPVVEVLETPSPRKKNNSETFGSQDRETFGHTEGFNDPLSVQKRKLIDAERVKKGSFQQNCQCQTAGAFKKGTFRLPAGLLGMECLKWASVPGT